MTRRLQRVLTLRGAVHDFVAQWWPGFNEKNDAAAEVSWTRMPEIRRLHETYANRRLAVFGLHSTRGADDAAACSSHQDRVRWMARA